jgi:hypothetical protein
VAKKDLARFFVDYLPVHPEERASLEAIADPRKFTKATVNAGARAGFDFSEDEVAAVLNLSESGAELSEAQLSAIAGGRAGGDRVKYMEVKLKEVLISST